MPRMVEHYSQDESVCILVAEDTSGGAMAGVGEMSSSMAPASHVLVWRA